MLEAADYPWYALTVKPRHEKKVAVELRGKGLSELLPLYRSYHRSGGRLQPVLLPLFPGYLFCSFDIRNRLPVLTCPGVFTIVGTGNHPIPLTTEELRSVTALTESGLDVSQWPYLETGERVLIQEGPIRGVEGILVAFKGAFRLVVSISLLHRSIAVEINRCWVQPVSRMPVSRAPAISPAAYRLAGAATGS